MKNKSITLISIAALGLSQLCLAQGTQTGGGNYFYKNDQVMLRDLADKSVCEMKTTRTLLEKFKLNRKLDEILNVVGKVHPYLAYQYKKDLFAQKWCLTSNLKQIRTDDPESVTVNYIPQKQLAIRDIDGKIVYLDEQAFASAKPSHQVMTLLHETGHSFLAKGLVDRNAKLRNLTKNIFLTYQALTEGRRSLESISEDLDASIDQSGAIASLESTRFGLAFDSYYKSQDQVSARKMHKLGTNRKVYFDIMVNDLGKPSLLAKRPFYDEMLASNVIEDSKLEWKYHFEFPLLAFHRTSPIECPCSYDEGDGLYNTALNHQTYSYTLGSCQVDWINHSYREAFTFTDSNTGKKKVLGWAYRVKSAPTIFGFDQYNDDRELNNAILEKKKSKYYSEMIGLLKELNAGYCENSSAPGLPYYPKF